MPGFIQSFEPDEYFTAQQQQRMEELLAMRRQALAQGCELPPDEYAEFSELVDAELLGAMQRATDISRKLKASTHTD